jgi:hypothetical protein
MMLVGCPGETRRVSADAGELSSRCVSSVNTEAIAAGQGFACGRSRWCDRVDGICKSGECGYDDDCEEGFACDTESNTCRPPCDLGGGIGCECTVDAECPALSFCWGGNCLNAGQRACSRDDLSNLQHGDCAKDPSRAGDPVQVVQCTPLDMGEDCVTDSDCAGSICNPNNQRCESLACMRPTCARDGDCASGQRCHPTANACVEDLGCRFANYFPQLACGEGQECDQDSNICRDIEVGECTEANERDVCRDLEICHVPVGNIDGRCVQCISDFECTSEAQGAPCQNQADCAGGTVCVADRNQISTCRYSTGTHCNTALGQCIGTSGCERDVDCMTRLPEAVSCNTDIECPPETYCENIGTNDEPQRTCLAPSGRRCASGTNECVLPLCNLDEDCQTQNGGDARWLCDTNMWRCTLPEPRCEGDGDDEPNNGVSTSTNLAPYREGENSPSYYTSTQILCRGDLDMYRLTIEDGQSIDATLTLDEAAFARELEGDVECTRESHCRELQDDAFCLNNRCHAALPPSAPFYLEIIAPETAEVIGIARLRDGNWTGTATATALNAGTYYFRVRSAATDADIFPYTLRVNLSTPPPCEIDEPNNTRQEATGLSVGEHTVQMRRFICEDDIDTYAFRVPRDHTVQVSMAAQADLTIRLLGTGAQEILAQSDPGHEVASLEWTNEEDAQNVYLVVTLTPQATLPEEANTYVLRVDVNPPFSCRGTRDVAGDRDSAAPISLNQDGLGSINDGALCEGADVDLYRIDLEPGQALTVHLNNSPRYPLDLRLLDADSIIHYGEGPNGFKQAGAVNSSGQTLRLFASVSWHPSANEEQRGTDVPFSLRFAVEQGDICPDPQAEGEPNNGRELATYLAASAQPLDRHLCGDSDVDWYDLNLVADTAVVIESNFTHDQGDIDLYLFDTQRQAVAVAASMDDNERIELAGTQGGHHFLLVERFAGGSAVQTYSLRSQYTEGCRDDQMEAEGGNTSQDSVTIRPGGGDFNYNRDLVLCSDSDWLRLVVLAGENVTVRVTGPAGMTLSLHALDGQNNAGDAVATGQAAGEIDGNTIYELTYQGVDAFSFFGLQIGGLDERGEYALAITVNP